MLLDRDLGNMVDLVGNLISNLVDNRGSGNSNRGSMGYSKRSSMSTSWSRSIDTSSQTMSEKTMSKKAMSIDSTGKDLSISISSGSSKATGNKGGENNKRLHIDSAAH